MDNKQPQNSQWDRAAHLQRFRWKPGQSGNPSGRPRGTSLHGQIAAILDFRPPATLEDITDEDIAQIVRRVVDRAIEGDIRCARIILDRLWPIPSSRRPSRKQRGPTPSEPGCTPFERTAAAYLGEIEED